MFSLTVNSPVSWGLPATAGSQKTNKTKRSSQLHQMLIVLGEG